MTKIISLIIAVSILACAEESERKDGYSVGKAPEDSLYHEIMQAHDTGMVRMGRLSRTIDAVQKSLDSIARLPERDRAAADTIKDELEDLKEKLTQAEVGMNLWMENFEPDSASDNKEKRIEYLGSEKVKAQKVRDDILNSLRKADSVFMRLRK